MELRQMRYFVAVAEELHFSRAADRLHISASTLSQQVKSLEAELGVSLLWRTSRDVVLAPAGARFLEAARATLAAAARAESVARDGGSSSVDIDIVTEGLITSRLAREFADRHPEIELTVTARLDQGEAVTRVLRGISQVTFGRPSPYDGPWPSQVGRRLVMLEPMVVIVDQSHPWAGRDAVRVDELRSAALLRVRRDRAVEWSLFEHEVLDALSVEPADMIWRSFPGPYSADEVVAGSKLVTLGLESHGHLCAGVVARPLREPVPLFPWYVVWRRPDADPVAALLADLAADVAQERGWPPMPTGGMWVPARDLARAARLGVGALG